MPQGSPNSQHPRQGPSLHWPFPQILSRLPSDPDHKLSHHVLLSLGPPCRVHIPGFPTPDLGLPPGYVPEHLRDGS